MPQRRRLLTLFVYLLATIQFAWCYMWITRPYVSTLEYEMGIERMPFQGRNLMILPMKIANSSTVMHWISSPFHTHSKFWFPRVVHPEVLMQAFRQ